MLAVRFTPSCLPMFCAATCSATSTRPSGATLPRKGRQSARFNPVTFSANSESPTLLAAFVLHETASGLERDAESSGCCWRVPVKLKVPTVAACAVRSTAT